MIRIHDLDQEIATRFKDKLHAFAALLEKDQITDLRGRDLACQANLDNCKVTIKPGRKYTKIDVGSSGKYMITQDGKIFGIKGYGVIHRGHFFGILDTINDYFWGRYRAIRKEG